jgi:hypothetical protein
MAYLRRSFVDIIDDVKHHYRRYPKRVDSDNLLGNLLVHIPRRWDLDDRQYIRFVDDTSQGVLRAFGLTSSINRGKVHESGVTLGKDTTEVVIATEHYDNYSDWPIPWREWASYRYLYHTRYDLSLPVLNNHTPGKGYGVATLDIPMLALQYRYWLKEQFSVSKSANTEQKESVYRFIGSYVLPNALDSYTDIAFFNRLSRIASGIDMKRHPSSHPFYVTDFSQRVDRLCEKIIDTRERRGGDVEQIVYTTPMIIKESLREVLQLPNEPITRHNEWALQLARLPYIKYIVEETLATEGGDRRFTNDIYTSLVEASQDRIFSGVGSQSLIGKYREQLHEMITLFDQKGLGWG